MGYKKYKSYKVLFVFLFLFSKNTCLAGKGNENVKTSEQHPIFMNQQEVEKYWRSPVKLPENLSCTVSVLVDQSGSAKQVNVIKSSGALIFDISARGVAFKTIFPQKVRGKQINIIFNQ